MGKDDSSSDYDESDSDSDCGKGSGMLGAFMKQEEVKKKSDLTAYQGFDDGDEDVFGPPSADLVHDR